MLLKGIPSLCFGFLLVINLTRAGAIGPPRLEGPINSEKTAFIDDSIKLTCKFLKPQPFITWYYNGELVKNTERFRIRRGTLKISRVKLSDAGSYICKGTNGYGSTRAVFTLGVKEICGNPTWGRKKDRTVTLAKPTGHDIEIDCDARGYPKPSITWYKNKQEIKFLVGKYSKDGWKLRIVDLGLDDEANYTCIVQNECGAINSTYGLEVIQRIMVAPILGDIENQTVVIGQDAMFTCKILTSDSQPFLQWLRHYKVNGSYVDENDEPYVLKLQQSGILKTFDDPQYLKITNVTEADVGWYTCLVANSVGMNYRSAWLTVLNDTLDAITEQPEDSAKIAIGLDKAWKLQAEKKLETARQKIQEIKEKIEELEEIIN